MKLRLYSILLCALMLASCAKIYQRETPDPCKDPEFVRLRALPIDSLTQRQYEYEIRKEQECEAYQNAKMTEQATDHVSTTIEILPVIELCLGVAIILLSRN
jgi:hypothetical protein